jgi:hypothetical protein
MQLTGDYDKEVENSHVIAHFVRDGSEPDNMA